MTQILATSNVGGFVPLTAADDLPSELAELAQALGTNFALVDGQSGELLRKAAENPGGDWAVWGPVCCELARRGKAELIDDREPLAVLGVPLSAGGECRHVAVGVFLTKPATTGPDFRRLAELLGIKADSAANWARRQICWRPEVLPRMATVVQGKLLAEARAAEFQLQVDGLSENLSTTYEEISLLYRLTENLRLSERMQDLGQLALQWLGAVIPARGLAAEFVAVADPELLAEETVRGPEFLSSGDCPLDQRELGDLVRRLNMDRREQPVVINGGVTGEDDWPFPALQNVVLARLAAGERTFGYLAAVNHSGGREFGTVEARLLGSVATILAIHCGNIVLFREQAEMLSGVVRALSSAIDAKDPYTCGHSDRVARVAVRLGQELAISPEMKNTLYLAGLLHDVGKIGISDAVLRKPGKLTPEEFEHIKTHAELGYKILRNLKKIEPVLPAVLHHHEAWDGHGYPHGLAGERIPLIARIIAVADAFDAMGSDRPYRKGMNDETLDKILWAGAGQQWDAQVVDAFFHARDDIREIARRERENLQLDLQHLS